MGTVGVGLVTEAFRGGTTALICRCLALADWKCGETDLPLIDSPLL